MFWDRKKDALTKSASQLSIDGGKKRRSDGQPHPDSPTSKRSKLIPSPPKKVGPRSSGQRYVSPPPFPDYDGTGFDGFEPEPIGLRRDGLRLMREATPTSDDEHPLRREGTPLDDDGGAAPAPVQRRAPPLARPTRMGLGRTRTLEQLGVTSQG